MLRLHTSWCSCWRRPWASRTQTRPVLRLRSEPQWRSAWGERPDSQRCSCSREREKGAECGEGNTLHEDKVVSQARLLFLWLERLPVEDSHLRHIFTNEIPNLCSMVGGSSSSCSADILPGPQPLIARQLL